MSVGITFAVAELGIPSPSMARTFAVSGPAEPESATAASDGVTFAVAGLGMLSPSVGRTFPCSGLREPESSVPVSAHANIHRSWRWQALALAHPLNTLQLV